VFDYSSIKRFRFVSHEFDINTSTAKLNYALDDKYYFTEEIIFNGARKDLSEEELLAVDNCVKKLHLIAGSSYYKTSVPSEISIENQTLTNEEAKFLEKLYLYGLGEFAHRNNLDLRGKIQFPFEESLEPKASEINLKRRTAVPVGGGKDSVVTIEALRNSGEPIITFSVGNHRAIREVVEVSGLEHILVTRKISPLLLQLNKEGALNGHVPISAIIAFILSCSAILYGFDNVAMSNERSASVGNFVKDGFEVNHQYSKGLEFEKDVTEYFDSHVLKGFRYFSFLRPLSEVGITKIFSELKPYHKVFTSCNAAFKIQEENRVERWCLECDKCRFVFLSLAPFLSKNEMLGIFGRNLFDEEKQIVGFEELLGVSGHKPFECVGEVEECVSALALVSKKEEWKNDLMVKKFVDEILPKIPNIEDLIKQTFSLSEKHQLTSRYEEILSAYSRS
jgi:hypothetical protein